MYLDCDLMYLYPSSYEIIRLEFQLAQALFVPDNYNGYDQLLLRYKRLLLILPESDFQQFIVNRFSSFMNFIFFLRLVKTRPDGKILNLLKIIRPFRRFLTAYGIRYTGLSQLRQYGKTARVAMLELDRPL